MSTGRVSVALTQKATEPAREANVSTRPTIARGSARRGRRKVRVELRVATAMDCGLSSPWAGGQAGGASRGAFDRTGLVLSMIQDQTGSGQQFCEKHVKTFRTRSSMGSVRRLSAAGVTRRGSMWRVTFVMGRCRTRVTFVMGR